ncbi:hypothetical protein Tco_0393054, partial [Tanacetum coccineum]
MRLSIRSWVTEWKGLPLLLLAKKQSRTVVIDSLLRELIHVVVPVNAVRLKLVLLVFVSAVKRMLMLPIQVSAVEALVDKKRVIVMESSIRRDLHLDDAEGTDCLPTATIFKELARMGAKSTVWNEFSSSMASLIICLATNQKFNPSKYIFDAMVKHLDRGVKFLMYPQMGKDSVHLTDSTHIPNIDQPSSSSQPKKKQPSKKAQRQEAEVSQDEVEHEESVPTPSNDPQPSGEDSMQLTELMVLCTKLQTQVLDLQKAKDAQAKEIAA